MRRVLLLMLAAVGSLVGCEESEIEPQVPVNAQLVQHERMKAPDIRDGFDQVAEASFASTPPLPPPRESVSLGYIGNEPLGRYEGDGPPPHTPPYWTRPFGTLPYGVPPYAPERVRPLPMYEAPYYPYYPR